MSGTRIIFDCPLSPWVVAAAGLAVLAAVAHFARRDAARLPAARRRLVIGGAALASLMIAAMALGPTFVRSRPDPHKPVCAILADASRSMTFPDAPAPGSAAPPTRAETIRSLLARRDGWLKDLAEDFELAGWRFAAGTEPLSLSAGQAAYAVDDEGYSTAVGDALDAVASAGGGLRPRLIVLMSDGASNAGADPAAVARVLGRSGTAVYVVPVGDPATPRDLTVLELRAPKTALLGDRLILTADVAAGGMGAVPATVELKRDGQVVDRKQFLTDPTGRAVGVTFGLVPVEPGRQVYTATVEPQPGEQDAANNSATAVVEIVERKIHALLVESEPRWEFRFIRNVFERDPAITMDVCLLRPGVGPLSGQEYREKPPVEPDDLAQYDLVLLGDVPARDLPGEFLSGLAEIVRRRGAALVVLAGRRGHYRELEGTPLGAILPVKVSTGARVPPLTAAGGYRIELTDAGAEHLVTRLDEGGTADRWAELPRLNWSADVTALAPGATALLVHPYRIAGDSKMPLLALHRVGAGKVLFVGVDETWRWRKGVGDAYHYRFWAQAARWMVRKGFTGGSDRARLSADLNACQVGQPVELEAYCLDDDGFPLNDAEVFVRIEREGGEAVQLAMQPDAGGWGVYRASFAPGRAGEYRMRPVVPAVADAPLGEPVTLQAARVDLERNFLAQDRPTLQAIAEAGGGELVAPGQIDALPAMLKAGLLRRMLVSEYSPCRHWLFLVATAGVLAATWLLRKRSGLA